MESSTLSVPTIDFLRIYFYRWANPFSFLTLATRLYHTLFNVDSAIDHVAIQLGRHFYEVTQEGTYSLVTINDGIDFVTNECVAIYEIDLTGMEPDTIAATKFMLDQDVNENRALNIPRCFQYLENYLRLWADKAFALYNLNYNLGSGIIRRGKNGSIEFNLPFTCSTQAANVLNMLFALEPIVDNHLPTSIFYATLCLSDAGYGFMLEPPRQNNYHDKLH